MVTKLEALVVAVLVAGALSCDRGIVIVATIEAPATIECGSDAGACPDGMFCALFCGTTSGTCEPTATASSCAGAPAGPECGCDGFVYMSSCLRRASGVGLAAAGESCVNVPNVPPIECPCPGCPCGGKGTCGDVFPRPLFSLLPDASAPTFPITPSEVAACQRGADALEGALTPQINGALGSCWVLPDECPDSGMTAAGCDFNCINVCSAIRGDGGPFFAACESDAATP